MRWPHDVRKWIEILLLITALGGAGGLGLEWRGTERYTDSIEYTDQVSIEFLEMELKYTIQIADLSARIARLEGTYGY